MPKSTVHRWWYEQLALAGFTVKGVQRVMNMHRARHTFATELRRDSRDLGVVQRMLGHDDIHTTEAYYGHYDLGDLEAAMEEFARKREMTPDASVPPTDVANPHACEVHGRTWDRTRDLSRVKRALSR